MAFGHGGDKHSESAAPAPVSAGVPQDDSAEKSAKPGSSHDAAVNSEPESHPSHGSVGSHNPGDQNKIENDQKMADEALNQLKYKATFMALGVFILIGGLVVSYSPSRRGE